jgi:HK97 family phage portal protein
MSTGHVLATRAGNHELRGANPHAEWGSSVPPSNSEIGGFTAAGIPVSQESALQIAAVYGCVSLLSSSVATLPMRLMDNKILKNAKELPPSQLITEPYSEISQLEWVVQFVASLALRGEFFGEVISRDRQLYPTQIKPIPADNANLTRKPDGTLEYRFFNKTVPLRNVYHVRLLTVPGMLRGVSPIQFLRLTLGLAMAETAYGASFFRNSANPHGVIEVPGNLPPDETKKMARAWLAGHQGINQANLPAILTEGAKFNPISITPEDAQFLASRAFSASEISGVIYRVPPHMLGLTERVSSWGRGIEQMELGFWRNTLQDYIARLEASLTTLHPPGQFVNLDPSHRLRGDTLERAQTASLAMLAGIWDADESRALFDMPARPNGEGKNLFSPINTELLKEALAQVEAAQKAAKEPQQAPSSNGSGDPSLIEAPAK